MANTKQARFIMADALAMVRAQSGDKQVTDYVRRALKQTDV